MNMRRGYDSRPQSVAQIATLMALASIVSGCTFFAKNLGTIALDIGTEIAVSAGAEYIQKIFSSDEAGGRPTLVISYTDAAGDGVGAAYAIDGADAITIEVVRGSVHLVNDGNGLAITVDAGTTATIEIRSAGDGSAGQVAADPEDQAVMVNGIISWSGRSRRTLFGALADLNACRDIAAATAALRQVANGRASQIDALDELDVSALPEGASIRNTLLQALRYSLDADLAFIRWGENAQRPRCRKDDNHDQAMAFSRDATATKKKFVRKWNPVARDFGLPEYKDTEV